MGSPKIATVVASAGAGKTYRIVDEIAAEVEKRDPEQIVATTFTVKAAAELIERARAKLFETGQGDRAGRLLGARFGTVNAICGQIVAEQAIGLGRSPRAEVIPEGSVGRLFAIAADVAIERHASILNDVGEAFGLFEPRRPTEFDMVDWRTTVRRIIELARANGIAPGSLNESADRSVETFLALLPQSARSAAELDDDLARAVEIAVAAVPTDYSATAAKHVELLRKVGAAQRRGERLTWPDWARLSKLGCAKKDGPVLTSALETVAQAAGRHPEHPRLREQCERYIRTLFLCAAEALSAYQNHKAQRGMLDFIDQESLALEVLRDPEMAGRLEERIGRLFVDEFQDSSPLQIAIFTAMAPLVDASTWVGDPKQAIYGFRNADSALTQAAFAGAAAQADAPQEVLAKSYRSRDGIIRFVNAAFPPALTAMGLDPAEHAFSGTARSEAGFDRAPLSVWWLEGKLELQYAALATAIRDAVSPETDWMVGEKPDRVRPMRAGDVAILCKSWPDIAKAAAALSMLGLKVSVEREGLAKTSHVELVMAGFRWVADPTEHLALAELARFLADDPESDLWLEAVGAEDQGAALRAAVPISADLETLREGILSLTPADLIDAVMQLPAIARRIESWGDVATRLEDLEALRGFARTYEADCAAAGAPATPSGLVLALADREPTRPASLRDDAITLTTYHGAKGLEWPCVVLTGLGKEPRPRLFEPVADAAQDIDWRDPLAGRWIRLWPWPYGSQSANVRLDEAALASPIGQQAVVRARDEDARLLYVGMTRARDHLVLAPPAKGALNWLTVLDGAGAGHVTLPRSQGDGIRAGDETFPANVATLVGDDAPATREVAIPFMCLPRPGGVRAMLHRRPSDEVADGVYRVMERIALGPRLPLVGAPDMRLVGEAVHAILASDWPRRPHSDRLARAQAILDRWGVHQVLAGDVLDASDRLTQTLEGRWPGGIFLREAPISARLGAQLVRGRIDLLVEHDDGFAIVDHKSFPGSRDAWEERATGYGPQLGLYAEALGKARSGASFDLFVHMPIVGTLVRVAPIEERG